MDVLSKVSRSTDYGDAAAFIFFAAGSFASAAASSSAPAPLCPCAWRSSCSAAASAGAGAGAGVGAGSAAATETAVVPAADETVASVAVASLLEDDFSDATRCG